MAASPERAMAAWTQAVTTARPPWAAGMAATLEGGGARRDQGRRAEDHHDRQLLDSLPHCGILSIGCRCSRNIRPRSQSTVFEKSKVDDICKMARMI
ncbi:hypothetical protein [Methylobacterium radiodurans]|uniref:hypothetical protein n=1 Tax=Methylobacterium radiodurans TaxID=2202828 RepID=UPI0013A58E58|nr:hypothetical protein [Methylobacterium radiodurans]